MEKGTVKWFNNAKGFGFICPEGGGEDIFAHYSTIQMDGYRTLKAGQSVQFDAKLSILFFVTQTKVRQKSDIQNSFFRYNSLSLKPQQQNRPISMTISTCES